MLQFLHDYWPKLLTALGQHLWIVTVTMALSLLLAALITALVYRHHRAAELAVAALSVVYAIPSLALFALMIPLTGLGRVTAVVVLTLYNQFLLLRNFLAGLRGVDPALLEAATAMGMTPRQRMRSVQLPLAFPVMMAGVHIATVSTIGIAAIAATINAGGLGDILLDGLRTQNTYKILWGTLLAAGLALGANFLLGWAEKRASRRLGA